jgi:hypothetical protein
MRIAPERPFAFLLFALFLFTSGPLFAAETYKPFIAVAGEGSTLEEVESNVVKRLKEAGFQVVGGYSPYADGGARIVGVTNAELIEAAAGQPYGGFGAVIRVAITNNNGKIEVGYVNPSYVGHAYHIGDLSHVSRSLAKALGEGKPFGAKGMSARELAKYHYMMMMPYFEDRKIVKRFSSQEQAVARIAKALQNPESDMRAVWQVKVDGNQTVFGVQLYGGKWKGQMANIMNEIDTETPRSTAALPWEILVTDGRVTYLPGRYRIAIMFPDLGMGTFMRISDVPDHMDESIEHLADLAE